MDDTYETGPSRKLAGIGVVALLHVVVIYALVSGLGKTAVEVLRAPLQAQIIQEVKPPPEAPPPPPVITPPPPYIPPPLIQVAPPPPAPVIAQVTAAKPPAPAPVARPAPARSAGLDPNQSCAAPEYPEDAQEMEQTGTSVLQFLIGPDGAVEQARVASSSGHGELDQTALQALGRCKFKPALGADGKPVEAWTSIRYVWTLN